MTGDPLAPLGDVTATWFRSAFESPTAAQAEAWSSIAEGRDTVVIAPTGSGKTLAAFLVAIDRIIEGTPPAEAQHRCRVLYISPLKALAMDVERNLRSPLIGVQQQAVRAGVDIPDVTVGIRTGDTSPAERTALARRPPDILITTPESLFLMLTSSARESLRGVTTVIIDEIHVLAGNKRGAHLALSLERLDALLTTPAQRIGLSATVSPIQTVARWLRPTGEPRVAAPPTAKEWDLQVRVPIDDMSALGTELEISGSAAGGAPRTSIWPHLDEELVDLIESHTSTLVFVNSRRLAERVTARINEIHRERCGAVDAGEAEHSGATAETPPLARAHHGSVSREQRSAIEEDLKAGRLKAVVATSSLELGIDMGAIDLVVQVESPPSVASGLQRVGRAGHHVGAVSHGVLLPKYRGDLVTATVIAERMRTGVLEPIAIPTMPLDVLAQQIVAAVAMDDWTMPGLAELVRRAAPFTSLTDAVLESVLDMLSGRYPSDEFAELRPRLVWDRDTDLLTGRPGAQRLAVTSGGTIPDRGLFAVHLVDGGGRGGTRVGELDEEMVYESRVGDVIALGASSWCIEQITHDRVLVSPAPGRSGTVPFWHGDSLGRPAELGRAIGEFTRRVSTAKDPAATLVGQGLDERAMSNLVAYLTEQRAATGRVPSDVDIVVERCRDELGDWRILIHSPYGARVHAPWALLLAERVMQTTGMDAQVMHSDDGIVLRLPDTDDENVVLTVTDLIAIEPDEVESGLTRQIGGSALFASRFRECASRALLLPRRRPDQRTPLWQQRQRSAQLLQVASGHPSFPIVLETVRECLQDVYDVPALRALLADIRDGRVRLHDVVTDTPSPFAQSLLFGYVASYLYEGDAPLAERRAAALALDTSLLAELLGTPELRDILDAEAVLEVEAQLQWRGEQQRLRGAEDLADLLRILGPRPRSELTARGVSDDWVDTLVLTRRAIVVRMSGVETVAAIEDAGRLREALGVALPPGIPEVFLDPGADPLGDLVGRFARSHGPFTVDDIVHELGMPHAVARTTADRLVERGRLSRGEFRPMGAGGRPSTIEYCDGDVLRRIRRRSVARLRQEIEPVAPARFATFLPRWQHVAPVGERPVLRGADGVLDVVEQLAGIAVPASTWLTSILPLRVDQMSGHVMDELLAAGEIVWWGADALAGGDGLICVAPADLAPSLLRPPNTDISPQAEAVRQAMADRGALFFRDLADAVRVGAQAAELRTDADLVEALWELVWAGLVTNDGWAALRARMGRSTKSPIRARRRPGLPTRAGPPAGAGRWSLLRRTDAAQDSAIATTATAEAVSALLERYGVLTRGAVSTERIEGGFSRLYPVLRAMEDAGRCQRVYAVDGLGAAQFALPVAIDRLRSPGAEATIDVLAATDPAQAYGATLPWPGHRDPAVGHRPGRKAGAVVVLVDGELVLYVERGGRTLLTWSEDDAVLTEALRALIAQSALLALPRFLVTRIDGSELDTRYRTLLAEAGFHAVPRGMRSPVTGG